MSDLFDELMRQVGIGNITNTPSLNKNDNDTGQNFYEHVMNSIEYHNEKLNQAFSKHEFMGLVLYSHDISLEDLITRTNKNFAVRLLADHKVNSKSLTDANSSVIVSEVFVHIPSISGLLPMPTLPNLLLNNVMNEEQDRNPLAKAHMRKIKRFLKFYVAHETRGTSEPEVLDVVKVNFIDENFMHYGIMNDKLIAGKEVFASFLGLDDVSGLYDEGTA